MENRNTSLYLYLALGVLLVIFFGRMFASSSSDPNSDWISESLFNDDSAEEFRISRKTTSADGRLALARRDQKIDRLGAELRQLEEQLARSNERFESARERADKQSKELTEAKSRLEDAQQFIDELLARTSTRARPRTGEGNSENGDEVDPDELRTQLQTAQQQLAALQTAAEEEVALLESEQQAILTATADAVVSAGSAAVPGLITALSSDETRVRAWAAYALGRIGSDASDAVEELQDALDDPDETVRDYAREALGAISP